MFMATKTITIMEDAYEKLAREKMDDESFSEVIRRITSRKNDLDKFFGSWTKDYAQDVEKSIEEGRKRGRKKRDELFTA
jgi:predicted CopG family antitoxin